MFSRYKAKEVYPVLGATLGIGDYIVRLHRELDRVDKEEAKRMSDLLFEAWQDGHFIFVFGNGGSACTASHLAEDLGKSCLSEEELRGASGRRLKILSLTDNVGWITALANDLAYDQVFVQQLAHYASPGDLVIAISGSGNSPNVLAAVDWANEHGLITFGLTGYDGGRLRQRQKAGLHVPLDDMGIVESIHLCVAHWVVDDLRRRITEAGSRVRS